MRKQSLLLCGLALLLLGVAAPSASADPGCNGNNWARGIYNDAGQKGRFDLAFNPTTPNMPATITGGAILCGTNPGAPNNGLFYVDGKIYLPNVGEYARCANPTNVSAYCNGQQNAGYVDLADGRYAGNATVDSYCKGGLFTVCLGGMQVDNQAARTYVDYNTNDGYTGGSGNRCTTSAYACYETRATLFTVPCNGDMIYEPSDGGVPGSRVMLHIYQMTCDDGSTAADQYLDTIDDLLICKLAGTVGGTSCGTSNPTANGTNRNGTGAWTYTLIANLSDSSTETATASGVWQ